MYITLLLEVQKQFFKRMQWCNNRQECLWPCAERLSHSAVTNHARPHISVIVTRSSRPAFSRSISSFWKGSILDGKQFLTKQGAKTNHTNKSARAILPNLSPNLTALLPGSYDEASWRSRRHSALLQGGIPLPTGLVNSFSGRKGQWSQCTKVQIADSSPHPPQYRTSAQLSICKGRSHNGNKQQYPRWARRKKVKHKGLSH